MLKTPNRFSTYSVCRRKNGGNWEGGRGYDLQLLINRHRMLLQFTGSNFTVRVSYFGVSVSKAQAFT